MKPCSVCNESFSCTAGSGECWCMNYPPVLEYIAGDCMCGKCLQEKVRFKLEQYIQTGIPATLLENVKQEKKLIENIDYYVENGLYVFTSWFHLKRGNCCGNGCRHCPYGNGK